MRRPFREDKNHMNHPLDADSKENRLTCHPVARPLSAVGLGNAESQAGANAALSDNDLLSRPRTSNAKKNQKQSPASPVCPASPAVGRAASPATGGQALTEHESPRGSAFFWLVGLTLSAHPPPRPTPIFSKTGPEKSYLITD